MGEEKPWYTNKDLFEMLTGLKDELRETREVVREFNTIQKQVTELMVRVSALEVSRVERYNVGKTVREWGGWLVAIASFAFAIWRTTK